VQVQRHVCHSCRKSYSEQSALLVRGRSQRPPMGWYAREVHRAAVDHWQHVGTSLRRTAELLRAWLGRQERWRWRRPLCQIAAKMGHAFAAKVVHGVGDAGLTLLRFT
jgi:hypothetical protein